MASKQNSVDRAESFCPSIFGHHHQCQQLALHIIIVCTMVHKITAASLSFVCGVRQAPRISMLPCVKLFGSGLWGYDRWWLSLTGSSIQDLILTNSTSLHCGLNGWINSERVANMLCVSVWGLMGVSQADCHLCCLVFSSQMLKTISTECCQHDKHSWILR